VYRDHFKMILILIDRAAPGIPKAPKKAFPAPKRYCPLLLVPAHTHDVDGLSSLDDQRTTLEPNLSLLVMRAQAPTSTERKYHRGSGRGTPADELSYIDELIADCRAGKIVRWKELALSAARCYVAFAI
jgi:hypothetical protein